MNTLTGYSKSTLTDNYVLSAAGGHLPLVAGRLWRSLTSVTIEEANVVWYIKVEIPGYSKPSSMLILGSYNNIIDLGLVEFSGFSNGYIYRNIQQNGGNVTAVCMSSVHNSTTKKWTFWIKMRPINNSSGESPTLSATYKIYFSESYTITATATTTDPGVAWQNTTTNLVIKNANLIGLATKSTNIAGGAKGSIPYQSDADTTAMLRIGSNGQVLKVSSSGLPEWSSDTNTDTKVTQTITTSNANYPLLLAPSGQTATTTGQSYFDSEVTLNPSTNILDKAKVYESLLLWGGYNIAGDVSPIDAAMSSEFAQNRLAFLNPDLITVEFTRDDGASWYTYPKQYTDAGTEDAVTTGYEFITNDQKQKLVTDGLSHTLWLGSRRGNQTASDKLRITILGDGIGLYIKCKKILVNYSQAYGNGSYCLVEAAMANAPDTFNTVKLYNISGWVNWNSIPYVGTLGEWSNSNRAANTRKLRLTFGVTSVTTNATTDIYINKLRIFGTDSYAGGNSLTLTGHLYSFDVYKNATFPANLKSTGSLTANGVTSTGTLTVKGNTTLGDATTDVITIKGKTTIEAGAGLVLKGNSSQNPLLTRSIKGSDGAGNVGDLYIQYGANKPIYLGNTGAHTISADGSQYSGTSQNAVKDSAGNVIKDTYLKLSGGTLTGPLTINSNVANSVLDAFCKNGSYTYLRFGRSVGTNNCGELMFNYDSNQSTGRYLQLGFYDNSVSKLRGYANGTWTINDAVIFTGSNYTDYVPKKDGTGASGTWGINITGNAATANRLVVSSLKSTLGVHYNYIGNLASNNDSTGEYSGVSTEGKYLSILRLLSHAGTSIYYRDLIFDVNSDAIWSRRVTAGGAPVISTLLSNLNIDSYALTSRNWNTIIDLSTYATQAYVTSEIAKAQLAGSNVVIPVTDVLVKTSGNFATVVSNNVAKIDLSTYATTTSLGNYLPLSGGTMTGVITTCTGNLKGLKFGTSYLSSISNLLLWQSPEAIRFGSSDWNWDSWAGLKYDHPNKTIYLGLADNTVFNANSAQSGGKVRFPGVSTLYMGSTNLTASTLNIVDTAGNKDLGMIVLGSAYRIGFIIGTGNVNRGIFDFTNQKWLLCKDASTTYITDWTGLGSATKPVYFTGGKPVACTYSLNKTVPSDALFTDTKNTAGSTNSTSKMYLVGATSQGANPQTYSNSNVYATDGTLTTSGVGKDGYIAYPKDGYYSSSLNSETGYLCITLPLSWTDTMIKFDVNIFNYLNNTSVTYTISGYMYSPTQQWYNVAAYASGHYLGGLSNLPVIFGHNGTKCVVYIGTATTTWAYPKIAISNITLGWSNTTTEKWSTGWGFAFTTSLGTYNANVQNTNVGYLSQLLQGKSAADFTGKYSWECTVNKNAWSRLCLVKYSLNHSGASYILNVLEHRTSVVYNYTYLVSAHHDKKGHITLLNNSNFPYSGDAEARLVVDTYGNSYFEFRDGTRLSDSWTSATVKCELIPLSTGDITKYTSYTSGSSVPSGYAVATTVLHTGEGIPNIDNYWKNAYNYRMVKTLNAPTSSLTFSSSNTSEVLLALTTFSTTTIGMTINLDFSGAIRAWTLSSGYSSTDGTTYHNQNNKLEYVYYVYVDGAYVGSYRLGDSYLALVVNSGTSVHVAIKAKLNKSFTTNAWWHCTGPADFYINSTSIGIKSDSSITITATASGAGNVLRNSESILYKNGFVFSDINSNSLTYCDKNQVIFKRGGTCFKLDSSGLTQSTNSGLSWSPITGMVTPL